jgi:uncharacterized protein with HEPN domain
VAPRSQLVRLSDILENIDAVAEAIEGVEFGFYRNDIMLRRAVERCIEIISEASRHIPISLKMQYPDQYWDEIAKIGNLLRHHYERVDDFIIWKIGQQSLPKLRPVIVAMIEDVKKS